MKKINKPRTSLTDEEIKALISIYESNIPYEEKREKSYEIIRPEELQFIKEYAIRNNIIITQHRLEKIYKIYEEYKPKFIKMYRCRSPYELEKRIKNLKTIYTILKSDKTHEEKVKIITDFGIEIKNFRNKYTYMLEQGKDDPTLDIIRKELEDLDFIIEEVEKITSKELVIAKNNYDINYNYAKFVIEKYISEERSYILNEFLYEMGITKEILKYCENVIKYKEPELYKKYIQTVSENNKIRCKKISITIYELYKGIKEGVLSDGTPMDILEFYKRVPFANRQDFRNALEDFINRNIPKNYPIMKTFLDYMRKSKNFVLDDINENKIKYRYYKDLDKNLIHNIFRYMRMNNLPNIYQVFATILNRVQNNEIDLSLLDGQERKINEEKQNKKNPYKLILK